MHTNTQADHPGSMETAVIPHVLGTVNNYFFGMYDAIFRASRVLEPALRVLFPHEFPCSMLISAGVHPPSPPRLLAAAICRMPPAKEVGPTTGAVFTSCRTKYTLSQNLTKSKSKPSNISLQLLRNPVIIFRPIIPLVPSMAQVLRIVEAFTMSVFRQEAA